jgi:hypothetical protein
VSGVLSWIVGDEALSLGSTQQPIICTNEEIKRLPKCIPGGDGTRQLNRVQRSQVQGNVFGNQSPALDKDAGIYAYHIVVIARVL